MFVSTALVFESSLVAILAFFHRTRSVVPLTALLFPLPPLRVILTALTLKFALLLSVAALFILLAL